MKAIREQNVVAAALACGLGFTSTALLAQDVPPTPAAPVLAQPEDFVRSFANTPIMDPVADPSKPKTIIRQSYDGVDFLGSHCGCLPPDTNAAVGNGFVVETVNVQIRIFSKANGSVLLDEPLSTFFGAPSGGDVYVVYDDTANRWYVSAFDSNATGLFLAVSKDGNPLDGFLPTYHLTNVGGFPDYNKPGFNKDAIFISFNNFGPGGGSAATIASIDKAAALSGTLTYFVSHPKFQFRAMPPAQMHRDKDRDEHREGDRDEHREKDHDEHHDKDHDKNMAGVEWFVSTDGTDAGGNTIRVTKMTNYLSNAPVFTYTSLPVTPYRNAPRADQPGGSVTTFPNTTTTQVQFHKGHLVTALASSVATDGFVYPKGLYYKIDVRGGTPILLKEGKIDPGPGVAVQMPSVDFDSNGRLGLTWMESSSTEFLSMWVATVNKAGKLVAAVAAPGGGFFAVSFRIGDYSTTVLDRSDDKDTFWSANEYIGNDGRSDIWRTHITSFRAKSGDDDDHHKDDHKDDHVAEK